MVNTWILINSSALWEAMVIFVDPAKVSLVGQGQKL